MKNLEKVEAYFNNELSDSEKNDFLNEVESNTELKQEYNFQKEVIDGIKEARKAELKAMLDAVPIATMSTASTGLYKIIAGGVATILLGTAAWYYVNSKAVVKQTPESKVVVLTEKLENENKPKTKETVSQPTEKQEKQEVIAFENEEQKTKKPQVITPNLPTSEDSMEEQAMAEENLDIPEAIGNTSINLSSKVNVEIKLKKKYDFHYQYSNKGIVLYGDFEEGLFEILELNKENGKKLYLYYKSNYYNIQDKSGEISPLKAVTDKKLKVKLEGLR